MYVKKLGLHFSYYSTSYFIIIYSQMHVARAVFCNEVLRKPVD